ncbi:MAG: zf-HC2 domain-containing protein, partial [Chlorobium sp.]|nr:zf-HC2 domain-containing protein [Chlorobium sp.]
CNRAEELLADRALGLLSRKLSEALENHIAGCERCSVEAERYHSVMDALQETAAENMHVDLSQRVMDAAGSLSKRKSAPLRLILPALAAAAVLLAMVITPMFTSENSFMMTRQEVLDAYSEDLEFLGISAEGIKSTQEFSYESYGVPPALAEYLVQ